MRYRIAIALLLLTGAPASAEEVQFQDGLWTPATAPATGTPQGELTLIRQALHQGRPRRALKLAKRFIRQRSQDPELEEAMFLAGQAQLDRGRYWQAYRRFEEQVDRFPAGAFLRRATAREAQIARAFLAGKWRRVWGFLPLPARGEGISILERVIGRVPGTELAAESLTAVADHYFQRRQWSEAALTYDRFVEMFAGRYDTARAEYMAALSLYRSFRGVNFQDTPLLEARQRFRSFSAKYPSSPQAQGALTALLEIEDLLAQKDYQVGRFYARIGRPRAAAMYYRLAMKHYPHSPWARSSARDLERLKLPAEPTDDEDLTVQQAPGVEALP